jgi:hypothetical protein
MYLCRLFVWLTNKDEDHPFELESKESCEKEEYPQDGRSDEAGPEYPKYEKGLQIG